MEDHKLYNLPNNCLLLVSSQKHPQLEGVTLTMEFQLLPDNALVRRIYHQGQY